MPINRAQEVHALHVFPASKSAYCIIAYLSFSALMSIQSEYSLSVQFFTYNRHKRTCAMQCSGRVWWHGGSHAAVPSLRV